MQAFPLLVHVMSLLVGTEERFLTSLAIVFLQFVSHMQVNGVFQITYRIRDLAVGIVGIADHMLMTIQIQIELELLQKRQIV